MKTSKFTDEQIAMALRQAEAGTPVGEICRSWASASRASIAGKSASGPSASASYASCASSGTRIANSRGS